MAKIIGDDRHTVLRGTNRDDMSKGRLADRHGGEPAAGEGTPSIPAGSRRFRIGDRCLPEATTDFMAELEACRPNLRRYARSLLRDASAADDLVQDCLERALARRHLWHGGESLRPWLFRIMHNLHANQVRKDRNRPLQQALDDAPDLPGPDEAHAGRVMIRELEAALDLLPAGQREIVLLVALSGMSYQECADALDLPVGTVMSRLFRGRERLRELLEGESTPSCGG